MRLITNKFSQKDYVLIMQIYAAARMNNPKLTMKQFTSNLVIHSVNEIIKTMEQERAKHEQAKLNLSEAGAEELNQDSAIEQVGPTGDSDK